MGHHWDASGACPQEACGHFHIWIFYHIGSDETLYNQKQQLAFHIQYLHTWFLPESDSLKQMLLANLYLESNFESK